MFTTVVWEKGFNIQSESEREKRDVFLQSEKKKIF